MSRLSILIPYLGNPTLLENTLVSVLENRPADTEILVVLGRYYEDPYDLGDEVQFVPTPNRVALTGCVNFGLSLARGEVVHVLFSGAEVAEGWADSALGHFDNPSVACVAPLVVDAHVPTRVVAAGVDYLAGGNLQLVDHGKAVPGIARSGASVLGPHPAAAFYRKSAILAVGRFDGEVSDRYGALDLAIRLKHANYRTILEPSSQVRLPSEREGAFRRALEAERFFWRWAAHFGWGRSLALHAFYLAADGCRMFWPPRIFAWTAGRLLGCLAIGDHQRCLDRLKEAEEAVERLVPRDMTVAAPRFAVAGVRPSRAGAAAGQR